MCGKGVRSFAPSWPPFAFWPEGSDFTLPLHTLPCPRPKALGQKVMAWNLQNVNQQILYFFFKETIPAICCRNRNLTNTVILKFSVSQKKATVNTCAHIRCGWKYGELFKCLKFIAGKDTLPLIPHRRLSFTLNILIPLSLALSETVPEILLYKCIQLSCCSCRRVCFIVHICHE